MVDDVASVVLADALFDQTTMVVVEGEVLADRFFKHVVTVEMFRSRQRIKRK